MTAERAKTGATLVLSSDVLIVHTKFPMDGREPYQTIQIVGLSRMTGLRMDDAVRMARWILRQAGERP